jgi:3-hydroxyanthranilate 3,4-dioxygenase
MEAPFNLFQWISENKELLKPPVGNKQLFVESGDYIIMIVGGPNARKDFHYNETEEFFFQLEGNIELKIQTEKGLEIKKLGPGAVYLHPAKTPHSPVRSANSVGLVIERKRDNQGFTDGLLWYCENCNHKLHEVYFELNNIETDFLPHFKNFYESEDLRTCSACGTQMETDPRFISKS